MDTSREESAEADSPLGGADATEAELEADNPAEEDTLKTFDPDDSPA